MTFTARERRTVLAALESWVGELGFHLIQDLQNTHKVLGADPLNETEVAALIARLAETDDLAALSEIVNASQVLAGGASVLRRTLGALSVAADTAIEIEAAADRVVTAVRQLQPGDRR